VVANQIKDNKQTKQIKQSDNNEYTERERDKRERERERKERERDKRERC
jgi:hypothetical protein